MDYLTLTPEEFDALTRLAAPEDIASVQLSRRDSFDHLCDDGFLIASVVPRGSDPQWRVAIGREGQTSHWGPE